MRDRQIAACLAAGHLDAPLIVVYTASGRAALALSNRRPGGRVLALTPSEAVARSLTLCWGVTPVVLPGAWTGEQGMTFAIDWAKGQRLVKPGQYVVLLRGEIPGQFKSRAVLAREVT